MSPSNGASPHQIRQGKEPHNAGAWVPPCGVISPLQENIKVYAATPARQNSTIFSKMLAANPPIRQVSTGDFDSDIEKLLSHFKSDLTKDEQDEIGNVSLGDLHEAIKNIQEKQRATRSYRNLKRIEPFVTGMAEYGRVIAVFANAVPIVAFVWVG